LTEKEIETKVTDYKASSYTTKWLLSDYQKNKSNGTHPWHQTLVSPHLATMVDYLLYCTERSRKEQNLTPSSCGSFLLWDCISSCTFSFFTKAFHMARSLGSDTNNACKTPSTVRVHIYPITYCPSMWTGIIPMLRGNYASWWNKWLYLFHQNLQKLAQNIESLTTSPYL
jgi:hypothetical protein